MSHLIKKEIVFLFYQWIVGFPNKWQFLVSLTEGAGCVLPGGEHCCYRTPELQIKDMALA
jgi:hypothetical protein